MAVYFQALNLVHNRGGEGQRLALIFLMSCLGQNSLDMRCADVGLTWEQLKLDDVNATGPIACILHDLDKREEQVFCYVQFEAVGFENVEAVSDVVDVALTVYVHVGQRLLRGQ
mmetsp:Transcript_18609/g.23163  ORF Transcript_18609/g.23163 Transcript_18609/m.23163 type:complete len:114 (-) Transcript_18609:243-584(-)|eukprot:CAMPEP_0170451748 /NCGR_PEP_ID=MMETSP0123-20130129/885_1 /TAXON_ID=182087 /ORGANISM="Favella ehrenbergii, Strain Fehren 1" /LENGTH=113 /DNA_ID=CAMNT_0010713541 /DNA_START=1755 /DNA_END=2096 /DNA_ORIENTATION=-